MGANIWGDYFPGRGRMSQTPMSAHLVFFKERPTDIAVQRVGEVVLQVGQSLVQLIRSLGMVNGHHEEIDKPGQ